MNLFELLKSLYSIVPSLRNLHIHLELNFGFIRILKQFFVYQINKLKECIREGEFVPREMVMKYVESHIADNMDKEGIILDGFPRDMSQVAEFEHKVNHFYTEFKQYGILFYLFIDDLNHVLM